MLKLKTEYTDLKDVKHRVEHKTAADDIGRTKEQILDELMNALVKKDRQLSA